jgi:hypothetical protein
MGLKPCSANFEQNLPCSAYLYLDSGNWGTYLQSSSEGRRAC